MASTLPYNSLNTVNHNNNNYALSLAKNRPVLVDPRRRRFEAPAATMMAAPTSTLFDKTTTKRKGGDGKFSLHKTTNSSRHIKHRSKQNNRRQPQRLQRNQNQRIPYHSNKNRHHPRTRYYEKVPLTMPSNFNPSRYAGGIKSPAVTNFGNIPRTQVIVPRSVDAAAAAYGGNVHSSTTASGNIGNGPSQEQYFGSNRVTPPPSASNKFMIRPPPPPPFPVTAKSNISAATHTKTRNFLPPTSFTGLLNRTVVEGIQSVQKTNKGYDCITTTNNSSSQEQKSENGDSRSSKTSLASTSSSSSTSPSLVSSSMSSSKSSSVIEGEKTTSEKTKNSSSRLEYDPRQPQYSPTYDPDPFRNDREYSPNFPSWYD